MPEEPPPHEGRHNSFLPLLAGSAKGAAHNAACCFSSGRHLSCRILPVVVVVVVKLKWARRSDSQSGVFLIVIITAMATSFTPLVVSLDQLHCVGESVGLFSINWSKVHQAH